MKQETNNFAVERFAEQKVLKGRELQAWAERVNLEALKREAWYKLLCRIRSELFKP